MEHNIVSVSGGKDSTALLLLAIERQPENLQAVFADTGHEHPMTYEYIHYLEQATEVPIRWVKADFTERMAKKREYIAAHWAADGVPADRIARALEKMQPTGIPFLDLCMWKGRFPSTRARFCSEELKRNVIDRQVLAPIWEQGGTVISWQGVRADESPARAALEEEEDVHQAYTIYRPLLKWTAADCFDMHKKHGIEPNPLYRLGMGRVGCMPCIHANKDDMLEIAKRFPGEVDRVDGWEALVGDCSKRGISSFFASDKTPGEHVGQHMAQPGIRAVVEWAKTGRGGRQFDFIRDEPAAACSSLYGLCE